MRIRSWPRLGGVYIATSSYSGATGDQEITGIPFRPSVVVFLATAPGGTRPIASFSADRVVKCGSISFMGTYVDVGWSDTKNMYLYKDGGNFMEGYITKMNADGFTLHWTVVGSIAASFVLIALK